MVLVTKSQKLIGRPGKRYRLCYIPAHVCDQADGIAAAVFLRLHIRQQDQSLSVCYFDGGVLNLQLVCTGLLPLQESGWGSD